MFVVLIDKKLIFSEEVIKISVRLLEDKNIWVILVFIGSEVDLDELRSIIFYKGDFIKVKKDEEFWRFVCEIIIKILIGMVV